MSPKLGHAISKDDLNLDPFIVGIQKTGFPLEFEIVQILQDAGWRVISNKYYVDNDEEKPREVDVVAYKVNTANPSFDVYTALIISCKKNEHNSWAFLTRDLSPRDPNADWEPAHFVIPNRAVEFVVTQRKKWASYYHEQARRRGVDEVLRLPPVEVFALQEMANGEKGNSVGKPTGDSQMFNSVMSLMKAQFYEMSVRRETVRQKPGIYQFNLVSVADTRFIRLHFEKGKTTPSLVDSEHYIARYIFNRKEVFARIVFVKSIKFSEILKDYDRLHNANYEIMISQENEFYNSVMTDQVRVNIFKDDFINLLAKDIRVACYRCDHRPTIDIKNVSLLWREEESMLEIDGIFHPEELVFLNGPECRLLTARLLKTIYRYEGTFCFTDDIPF